MNAIAKLEVLSLQKPDEELIPVLSSSIWPGASPASVKMALDYCRAANLDPLQKPVHIMQVSVKEGENYRKRDVVFPGIGVYRTQASRTNQYAGMDEPEFGPECELQYVAVRTTWSNDSKKTDRIDAVLVYPEWCKVTVYRMVGGVRCPWTAKVRWLETYATAARGTNAPNEMWEKRTYGQLEKCAEALALRKAFPEIGHLPTAEEMVGRDADEITIEAGPRDLTPRRKTEAIDVESKPVESKAQPDETKRADPETAKPVAETKAPGAETDDPIVGAGQEKFLANKAGDRFDELLKEHKAERGKIRLSVWNAIKATL